MPALGQLRQTNREARAGRRRRAARQPRHRTAPDRSLARSAETSTCRPARPARRRPQPAAPATRTCRGRPAALGAFAARGAGPGWLLTPPVSQLPIGKPLLGQSPHDGVWCSSRKRLIADSPRSPGPQPRPRAGTSHRGRRDGGRPLGRPRRQGGRRRRRRRRDPRAGELGVDARRGGDRRGRERQRPDAVQRRGGRQRRRPGLRLRRRPDRRHNIDEQGSAQRDLGAGGG